MPFLFNPYFLLQQEALTGDLFNDMPFAGGYKSETDDCYINQFGIYFNSNTQNNDDDDSPVNMPSQGTNWYESCMEAKYRTYVTLQQMIEFAFIGGLTSLFGVQFISNPFSDEKTADNAGHPKLLPTSVDEVCNAQRVNRSLTSCDMRISPPYQQNQYCMTGRCMETRQCLIQTSTRQKLTFSLSSRSSLLPPSL